jgi:hypothetical protein
MDGKQKAQRYRDRAAELRRIAEALPPDNSQRMILRLAREYERLAEMLDQADVRDAIVPLKKPE